MCAILSLFFFTDTWSTIVIDAVDNTALHLGAETMVETLALSSSVIRVQCQLLRCLQALKSCWLFIDISQNVSVFNLTYFSFNNAWAKKSEFISNFYNFRPLCHTWVLRLSWEARYRGTHVWSDSWETQIGELGVQGKLISNKTRTPKNR